MTKEQLEKDRADMMANMQRALEEQGKWARVAEQCRGIIQYCEKQLKDMEKESRPLDSLNRATRRRLAKVKG